LVLRDEQCYNTKKRTDAKEDDYSGHNASTFLIKAGGVVRAAQATDGSTRSAGTTTTYHRLICGGDPLCEVIRG